MSNGENVATPAAADHQPSAVSSSVTNPFDGPLNELESTLKAFTSSLNIELVENRVNQEMNKKTQQAMNEINKANMDQLVEELYDKAQTLETIILKHRLHFSRKMPEQLLKEEIDCLKAELNRKEELLNDAKQKTEYCENVLRSMAVSLEPQFKNHRDGIIQSLFPQEMTSMMSTAGPVHIQQHQSNVMQHGMAPAPSHPPQLYNQMPPNYAVRPPGVGTPGQPMPPNIQPMDQQHQPPNQAGNSGDNGVILIQ